MSDRLSTTVFLLAALFTSWPIYRLLQEPAVSSSSNQRIETLQSLDECEFKLSSWLTRSERKPEEARRILAESQSLLESLRSEHDLDSPALSAYEHELQTVRANVSAYSTAEATLRTQAANLTDELAEFLEAQTSLESRDQILAGATMYLAGKLHGELVEDPEGATALIGRLQWFAQRAEDPEPFESCVTAIRALEDAEAQASASLARVELGGLNAIRRDWSDVTTSDFVAARKEMAETGALAIWALLGLLGVLTLAATRMRRVARAMSATQQNLELRVKERTDQLVKTNQDLRDQMSERRKAELDTRAARQQAEVASQTKSEFLANMSHEIRTPMTAILGFSERLLDPTASETERQEAVATIRRNGSYLLQIINDILDLSKIEAGKLQIERITTPTVDIARDVLELLAPRAEEKGLKLSVEYSGPIPQFVETDTVRLRQILLNLVGNSIKFTQSGGIVIRIECVEEPFEMSDRAGNQFTGVRAFLKFSVIDSGIGMTDEQLSHLFRPFTQADNSTTRNFGGTGLGLSISKSLCNLLGGRIEVASRPGQGSRFTFTVDPGRLHGVNFVEPQSENVVSVPELPQRNQDLRVTQECRVLLAEDGLDNQRLIRYILERAGVTVSIVSNGEYALNHALAGWRQGDPFDVVLMDMQMPVMDGYTAVRELRAAGYTHPIIALTAHAMATDRAKCLEIGCDAFCPKPVDKRELISMLNQFGRAAHDSPPKEQPAPAAVEDPFDGDPEMLELVAMFIEDIQADVVALRAAAERGDIDKIATIAHQLKGCAGGYGFPAVGELAARVETLARSGDDQEGLRRELETLCRDCQDLKRNR